MSINTFVIPPLQGLRQRYRAEKILLQSSSITNVDLTLRLDVDAYIKKYLKKGVAQETIPWENLDIDFFREGQKTFPYHYCACRYDARLYFILSYKPNGQDPWGLALVGFRTNPYSKKVLIDQIQGLSLGRMSPNYPLIDNAMEMLKNFRWEKMLIKLLEDWATNNRFTRVGIRKSRFNHWRHNGKPEELGLSEIQHNERLRMHYDITAKRMGYRDVWFSRYRFKKIKH